MLGIFNKIKLIAFIALISIIFLPSNFNAISLQNNEEFPDDLTEESEICANQEYIIFDEGNEDYKSIYIYDEDNYFLEEYQTNQEETTIIIPNDVSYIKIRIFNMSNDGEEEALKEYDVNDCGLEKIKNPYKINKLKSDVIVGANDITFELPTTYTNYSLKYKTENESKAEKVNDDTIIKIDSYPFVVQFNENYTNDKGKSVSSYYELSLLEQGDYSIREVDSLDVTKKGVKPISNLYFMLLILFVILYLISRNREKKYRKKVKRLKSKKRGKVKKATKSSTKRRK